MHRNSFSFGLFWGFCSICLVCSNSYPPEFTKQVQEYPDIISETLRCRPRPGNYMSQVNYVCDPDKILSVAEINSLNAKINDIKNNINKDSLGPCDPDKPKPIITIALVNNMKITQKKNEEVLNFASVFTYYLFEEWKIPTTCPSESDKIVIFYSVKDGSLYTYAGTLLNQRLSSKQIIHISVASKPYFGTNIASGLTYMLERYKKVFIGRDKGILGN